MTFLMLVRKNAWRKPFRSILLTVCVAIAFLIYGLTTSFVEGSQGTSGASDDILGVMNAGGRPLTLPMAYLARITAEPGVAAVSPVARLRGFVNTQRNIMALSAVDPEQILAVNGKELGLTPPLIAALNQDRDGILVGRALASSQNWSVGDTITLTTFQTTRSDGGHNWRFAIKGIFNGESTSTDTYFAIGRYDYVNATRAQGQGRDQVDTFAVRPGSSVSPAELASRIDHLFVNSAAPTRTQSERQFLSAFLRQYADITLIVDLVIGAAFVTLLLIVINTMIFAVRERTFEIAILKTLGFSNRKILVLVLSETLFVFVIGGLTGLALAKLATVFAMPALGLSFSPLLALKASLLILALGMATGLLPAFNAMRTPVIKAFRTR
ncbi:ABC transporter permease [Thalassospira sp. TSL5-1]|uniref:ABC transporter permease n=1 Tax=Thalassospira sp. TSL5-1 TaxID=1544451 RepID=UPI00093B0C48|nr:FtsX-like permease family protein [Thalassospira sp. TSL5-1]OKH86539.1 membrane protein [Thalassospira sp. TSL5-1]